MSTAIQHHPSHRPQVESHGYMSALLDTATLKERVDQAVYLLRKSELEFDAVAFRGISGAILGPQIAVALNKSMILVRKRNDGSHSQQNASFSTYNGSGLTPFVEGDINARTYIIIDDFQSTGATAKAIVSEIKKVIPTAICLGVCEVTKLYPDNEVVKPIKFS